MAAIDKIYGTYKEYWMLRSYLSSEKPEYIKWLYSEPDEGAIDAPLCNFGKKEDKWLWQHCPLDFVRNRLREQYNEKELRNWKKQG